MATLRERADQTLAEHQRMVKNERIRDLNRRRASSRWFRACPLGGGACGAQQLSRIHVAALSEHPMMRMYSRAIYCIATAVDRLTADGHIELPPTRCADWRCSQQIGLDIAEMARWCDPESLRALCAAVGATVCDLRYALSRASDSMPKPNRKILELGSGARNGSSLNYSLLEDSMLDD